jgi:hypothetical protein
VTQVGTHSTIRAALSGSPGTKEPKLRAGEDDRARAAGLDDLTSRRQFAIAKRHRIPLSPVHDVDEVMRDHHHMHERGMLE